MDNNKIKGEYYKRVVFSHIEKYLYLRYVCEIEQTSVLRGRVISVKITNMTEIPILNEHDKYIFDKKIEKLTIQEVGKLKNLNAVKNKTRLDGSTIETLK